MGCNFDRDTGDRQIPPNTSQLRFSHLERRFPQVRNSGHGANKETGVIYLEQLFEARQFPLEYLSNCCQPRFGSLSSSKAGVDELPGRTNKVDANGRLESHREAKTARMILSPAFSRGMNFWLSRKDTTETCPENIACCPNPAFSKIELSVRLSLISRRHVMSQISTGGIRIRRRTRAKSRA